MRQAYDNARYFALALAFIFALSCPGWASPPVPPPIAGGDIINDVDVELSGDLDTEQSITWTWVHDTDPNGNSTLAHGNTLQYLDAGGRAAQILYLHEADATDGLIQYKNSFSATSHDEPNLKVSKDMGYVASETSLIANAMDRERVGLSIVANGDTEGLGDMPSLCPWAGVAGIPGTNEFIAAGSSTSTTSLMVSHTDSDVIATGPPSLNHKISAEGIGTATAAMRVRLMEGGSAYTPGGTVPDLVSLTEYRENTGAAGIIDKFDKSMHYHSTIPQYQMPEPWYFLQ